MLIAAPDKKRLQGGAMNIVPLPQKSVGVRLKLVLFVFIGLMLMYVLFHTEHFLIDSADPSWPHYYNIGRWLLPHGLIGALALVLSFMQFSSHLRTRYTQFHRLCGRIYITSVCIVAPIGAYISVLDESIGYTPSFMVASTILAVLWMFATLMAFWQIRAGRVEQHRQWMTRSLTTALVFLEVRVVGGLSGWEDTPASDTVVIWACVALAYPFADTALQIEDFLRSRAKPERLGRS
jgi:uncharacterized membrane protein